MRVIGSPHATSAVAVHAYSRGALAHRGAASTFPAVEVRDAATYLTAVEGKCRQQIPRTKLQEIISEPDVLLLAVFERCRLLSAYAIGVLEGDQIEHYENTAPLLEAQ